MFAQPAHHKLSSIINNRGLWWGSGQSRNIWFKTRTPGARSAPAIRARSALIVLAHPGARSAPAMRARSALIIASDIISLLSEGATLRFRTYLNNP